MHANDERILGRDWHGLVKQRLDGLGVAVLSRLDERQARVLAVRARTWLVVVRLAWPVEACERASRENCDLRARGAARAEREDVRPDRFAAATGALPALTGGLHCAAGGIE